MFLHVDAFSRLFALCDFIKKTKKACVLHSTKIHVCVDFASFQLIWVVRLPVWKTRDSSLFSGYENKSYEKQKLICYELIASMFKELRRSS